MKAAMTSRHLSGFLEEVALVADVDNVDGADNRVLLMTLHSAKGLEFPYVYLSGMEDGIFPSYMTIYFGRSFRHRRGAQARLCGNHAGEGGAYADLRQTAHGARGNAVQSGQPVYPGGAGGSDG